jgi:hypothetical protein
MSAEGSSSDPVEPPIGKNVVNEQNTENTSVDQGHDEEEDEEEGDGYSPDEVNAAIRIQTRTRGTLGRKRAAKMELDAEREKLREKDQARHEAAQKNANAASDAKAKEQAKFIEMQKREKMNKVKRIKKQSEKEMGAIVIIQR